VDNKGTIDKYIGDSVMAFWGAPSILENHAAYACYSAIIIRDQLHALARRWNNKGEAPFATRIGINSGDVIVGNMGSHHRLNYTVIGDAVNLASRLEGMNKVYSTEIIVSESTHRHCRDKFEFRLLDRVTVRGRKGEVYIYELICVKDDIDINLKKIIQHYETGMKYYFSRRWQEALKCFATVVKYRPGDMPSKQMHERCLLYLKNPPPENWNGVFETTGV
jgi:adenylate cyclase